jgi:hypothetical protein
MPKFRKKPVIIDAVQWFKPGDHPAVLNGKGPVKWPDGTIKVAGKDCGFIDTLEGGHIVTPGDWIITGVQGEHYPCKPDIFEATYEPV